MSEPPNKFKLAKTAREIHPDHQPDQVIQPRSSTSQLLTMLPDEVLIIIFKMFHHQNIQSNAYSHDDSETLFMILPRVCRRWRDICKRSLHISLNFWWVEYYRWVTDDSVCAIVNRFRAVDSIDLAWCGSVSAAGFAYIALSAPKLTSINLSQGINVRDRDIQTITSGCPQLISIDISHCRNITDATLGHIGANCHKLKYINFVDCGISDAGLALLGGCSNLDTILLTCGYLSHATSSPNKVTAAGIHKCVDQLPLLKSIHFAGRHVDQVLQSIGNKWPQLSYSLDLCLYPRSLYSCVSHHPQLAITAVTLTSNIRSNIKVPKGLVAMAENWHKLTSVTLQRCNTLEYNVLEMFVMKAQNLKHLTIECCAHISEEKVECLVATHPKLNIQFTPSTVGVTVALPGDYFNNFPDYFPYMQF